jgi:RimJ/RimL family protein N-acetyltransferase
LVQDGAYTLERRDYGRAADIFQDLSYNLVIDSVMAGHTPAWVTVDDALSPRSAWMWNRMGTMLLVGRAGNDGFNRALSTLLDGRVVPDARRRQIPSLTLHYSPETWKEKLDVLLPGIKPERTWRRFYAFQDLTVDWRDELPSGCSMRRIDQELLRKDQLKNVDHVVGWVHSFWHSIGDFDETGFGFCVVEGGAIVSWCLTVYASGSDVELGLATVPEHRNRGYATLAAAGCVEHGIERGFTLHWHCDEENRPSIRVAEKVGFSDPTRYKVYTFEL